MLDRRRFLESMVSILSGIGGSSFFTGGIYAKIAPPPREAMFYEKINSLSIYVNS
jgi:hypothetical protein